MRTFSRRTFLKAAAAATIAGAMPLAGDFTGFVRGAAEAPVTRTPSTCNGCSTNCAMFVYVKNGRLWKLEGNPIAMKNEGKLCARAYGVAADVYNPDRVQQPMKRVGDKFEPISWGQAFKEIGDKLTKIIDKHTGSSVLWLCHGGKEAYAQMLLDEIGSANYVTHYSTCFTSKTNAWDKMVGTQLTSDINRAKYMVFAGRNYAGGIMPGAMKKLMRAKERGAKIVVIDPRLCELAKIADEWIPIRPGTDLALYLGLAHTLISEKLYNESFVRQYVFGFDEFWQANRHFTAEKAAAICDIPAETIRRLAREMARNAPASFLEPGYHGLHNHYVNSTQIAQANVIVNALLGNFYQHGGLMPSASPKLGKLALPKRLQPEKGARADGAGVNNEYPTVETSRGIAQHMPDLIAAGKVKALFIYHFNPLRTAPDPEYQKRIINAELVVSIPVDWNETSVHAAHYILPEHYFLERMEAPKPISGNIAHDYPQVAMRFPALKPLHNTKDVLDILKGIAKAMNIDDLYPFTVEEDAAAQLKPLGITVDKLREVGCYEVPEAIKPGFPMKDGKPALNTVTGQVEFSVGIFKLHGRQGVPTWIPPLVSPKADNEFRLIHGKQPWHSHSVTSNNPHLLAITKSYNGTWMWINKGRAEKLGIKNGDIVTLEAKIEYKGERRTVQKSIPARVTEMLHPECVWIPSGYGNFSPRARFGYQQGVNYNDFAPARVEPLSGGCMVQEVIVTVRKGGN
ncbi:MAG: respiratory selenite reductase catalytic subunit SrrA [Negativicutes bacterium]|nr:respiratory selenite reductase catalytic subunit SrrA [Negativicutes bacterium]